MRVTCTSRVPSDPSWKKQDPQLPKSIWYMTDAQWLGFRLRTTGDAALRRRDVPRVEQRSRARSVLRWRMLVASAAELRLRRKSSGAAAKASVPRCQGCCGSELRNYWRLVTGDWPTHYCHFLIRAPSSPFRRFGSRPRDPAVTGAAPVRGGRGPHGHARPDHRLCARGIERPTRRSAPHSIAFATSTATLSDYKPDSELNEITRVAVHRPCRSALTCSPSFAHPRILPRRRAAPSTSRSVRSSASGAKHERRATCQSPRHFRRRRAAPGFANCT